MKHTPLPYITKFYDNHIFVIHRETDFPIALVSAFIDRKTGEDNALFIAQACNHYEELLEACQMALKELKQRLLTESICIKLEEAIAKAEAK